MRATKTLPAEYQLSATIRLSKNTRLFLLLNLLGLLLFFGFGWLFVQIALLLRPDAAPLLRVLTFPAGGGWFLNLSLDWFWGVLLALVLVPLLHEATHGLVFWFFTRARPRFAYRLVYAYAAAPEWYIPRGPYLLVGLAPLVVLSLTGVACLLFIPQPLIPFLIAFLVFNAAGAVGDIAVVVWLLFQPATLLARDSGDALALYCPASAETN
jgi:hypothetical protein